MESAEPSQMSANEVWSLFDLSSRVVVVTGGTQGLGRAMVAAFARCGAEVIVVSRRRDACEEVAAEVRELGGRAVARPCHIGHWDELEPLVEGIYEELGRIDVLVNNAGSSPLYGRLSDVSEALWDKTLALNLKGPFRLSALVGERMAAGNGGSIINVSSVGAVRPTRDIVPYAAAKAGVNAMTVAFADALGPKVRVNAIMPGPFLTRISEAWDRDVLDELTRNFPMRRAGNAEEIVGAALYLASDASSYTTGIVMPVDGGAQWARPMGGDSPQGR
jgi:NAD(P)-dependent dehydrogenase (short-subunit alcohol dehydrogenase family)